MRQEQFKEVLSAAIVWALMWMLETQGNTETQMDLGVAIIW